MSGLTPTWKRLAVAPAHEVGGDQDYALLSRLGRGGMASVYLARQLATGRLVAIKVVDPDDLDDFDAAHRGEVQQRLVREARAVAAVRHPNIVEFLDAGLLSEKGSVFIAMEYLEGCTLRDALRERGTLAAPEVAAIGAMIARGVAAAHAVGIVHRDLKPSNVMLVPREPQLVAKVFDFGIAKLGASPSPLTLPGTVLGTPYYMSPEQCRGAADVDHRSDIYSLGVVLYVALAGRCPFQGRDEARVLRLHQTAPVPSLADAAPGAPRELIQLVERCLAKAPDERPQSMAGIAAVLEAFAGPTGQPWRMPAPRAAIARRPPVRAGSYATPPTQAIRGALVRRVDADPSGELTPVAAPARRAVIAVPPLDAAPRIAPLAAVIAPPPTAVVAPPLAITVPPLAITVPPRPPTLAPVARAVVAPERAADPAALVDPARAASRRLTGARLAAPPIGPIAPIAPIAVVPVRRGRRRAPLVTVLLLGALVAGSVGVFALWPGERPGKLAPVAPAAPVEPPTSLPAVAVSPVEARVIPAVAPPEVTPIVVEPVVDASPPEPRRSRHARDRADDRDADDRDADDRDDRDADRAGPDDGAVLTEDDGGDDDARGSAGVPDVPAPGSGDAPHGDAPDVRDPDDAPSPRDPRRSGATSTPPTAPRHPPPRPPREHRDFERLVF